MKLGEGHRSCPNGGWQSCKYHDSLAIATLCGAVAAIPYYNLKGNIAATAPGWCGTCRSLLERDRFTDL